MGFLFARNARRLTRLPSHGPRWPGRPRLRGGLSAGRVQLDASAQGRNRIDRPARLGHRGDPDQLFVDGDRRVPGLLRGVEGLMAV